MKTALFFIVQIAALMGNAFLPMATVGMFSSDPPQLAALLFFGSILFLDSAFVGVMIKKYGRTDLLITWLGCVLVSEFVAIWLGSGDIVLPISNFTSFIIWLISSAVIFIPAPIAYYFSYLKKTFA